MVVENLGRKVYKCTIGRIICIRRLLRPWLYSWVAQQFQIALEHFRYLVQCLNPLYPIPGQNSLSNEINVAYKNMKAQVELFLIEAHAISLCADIWTKRGLSSSYLGVTAQFFSLKDQKLHNVVLAVRSMSHPHTCDAIKSLVEDIVAEWEIPIDKIQTITTDNGSNMIKAFRDSEKVVEVSEDDELCIEEGFDVDVFDDIHDFETRENEHQVSFAIGGFHRLSCFAHTLQLVVLKFNTDQSMKEILKK